MQGFTASMRLGVYSDLVFRRDGDVISNNRAFIRFIAGLAPHVEELVLFGRMDPEPGRSHYELPSERVRVVPLPFYRKATALGPVVRAVRGSARAFGAELDDLDVVWVFGPQPMSMIFALQARRRRAPLVLGVRHDYPEYIRNRLPSRAWVWAVGMAHIMDRTFRYLARRAPTVALGERLADRYAGGAAVLNTGFSLVPAAELRSRDASLAASWEGELTIVSVGRLDTEKNPLLLLDIVARLRAREPRWRMLIAGDGPLREPMEHRIEELGLQDSVRLLGEVPNGPALWSLYRSAHMFLHVSFTEGLPQVLLEAQASGLPIVATDVGGVAEALQRGDGGLLVAPDDADAAVAAVQRLADDPELRKRMIEHSLRHAAGETLEAQLERLTAFLSAAARPSAGAAR